ncbi:hypothetical protein [Peptostreptococcus canis]|uniref:Phage protein n=1 Tax=Peptostreptococcus canis TaxID=1159213 RepID=A0ABR6TIH6_9FIRM|nr:hypothetical protein [Peptostreptococcus canis]MBC2575220.1 hypothetical protein [Peptostreptococcus canis]MBP1997603.1 hypothetical protein [Peptostreptococcus canis]
MKLNGKTSTGFEYEIDVDKLDDMNFIELLSEVDSNPILLPKIIEFMLGKDGKKKLYEHVSEENGRVSIKKIEQEMADIIKSQAKIKN